MDIRIVDITDESSFRLVPPCADPGFDHRSCDYWEDADRGSRAARLDWLEPAPPPPTSAPRPAPSNPFAREAVREAAFNPFATSVTDGDLDDNPFAPRQERQPSTVQGPRKLGLLARGAGVFGSYAKVLLAGDGDGARAYAQFGPLSAYPRALRLRELYPQLPSAPPPAVITCIATTREARGQGFAQLLVEDVCVDLSGRGFAAVEAYPTVGAEADATSAATIGFWKRCGFEVAIADERYPVVRRELE